MTAAKKKLLTRVDYQRDRLCEHCGQVTVYKICERCRKHWKEWFGISGDCYLCKAVDICTHHDQNRREKCKVCGREDVCNAKRGGLCLDCYAKVWCKLHPVKFRIPTVKERTERTEFND